MHRNKSVDLHQFTMVKAADIPRSRFKMQHTHKTTFDAGYLIPIYVDEVLPGDTFNVKMTAFTRLSTPLFPIMDNMYLDSFFFFVPNRLIWDNWVKMMGEQRNPGDSISFVVPTMTCPAGGYAVNSLQDYMGLPTVGQMGGAATYTHAALHTRAYNLIWNEWFRDENLQNSVTVDVDDGPDDPADYVLLRRGKRKDYFTSALPWPQKGNTAVTLPLGTTAPVKFGHANTDGWTAYNASTGALFTPGARDPVNVETTGGLVNNAGTVNLQFDPRGNLYADLSAATAATINQIRQAFQIQKLLERDARGGTRYTEILLSHFRVRSPDARLQRPEYLGGGSTRIAVNPVAQTSGTNASGTTTPLGNLAAVGTGLAANHGFTQSFVEHGVIIGLVMVRADLTYQQGVRKMWNRSTRYDFYWPVFSHLGEQAVLNREIYADGSANDTAVFGYQERWGEYRNNPSKITGLFRSTATGTLDAWHLAQKFASVPTLNSTFIQETPPVDRIVAVGSGANGKQFICDTFFDATVVRPLPMYGDPGLIDHF